MALSEQITAVSYEAAGALDQYTIGTIDTATPRTIKAAAAADRPDGVIYNRTTAAGQAATVVIGGIAKVKCGSTIGIGVEVGVDADGLATATVGAGGALGISITGGDADEIIEVQL